MALEKRRARGAQFRQDRPLLADKPRFLHRADVAALGRRLVLEHETLPETVRGQLVDDQRKDADSGHQRKDQHGHCGEITAERHHEAVEHGRHADAGHESDSRQQHLDDDAEDAAEEEPNLEEVGRPFDVLAAPENDGRDESEHDACTRAARLDLDEYRQEHDGQQQDLQDRHGDAIHKESSLL